MIGSDQSSEDHTHTNSTSATLSVRAEWRGTDGTLEKQRAGTRRHDRVFRLSRSIHSRQWQTELRLIFLVPRRHSSRVVINLPLGRRPIGS